MSSACVVVLRVHLDTLLGIDCLSFWPKQLSTVFLTSVKCEYLFLSVQDASPTCSACESSSTPLAEEEGGDSGSRGRRSAQALDVVHSSSQWRCTSSATELPDWAQKWNEEYDAVHAEDDAEECATESNRGDEHPTATELPDLMQEWHEEVDAGNAEYDAEEGAHESQSRKNI